MISKSEFKHLISFTYPKSHQRPWGRIWSGIHSWCSWPPDSFYRPLRLRAGRTSAAAPEPRPAGRVWVCAAAPAAPWSVRGPCCLEEAHDWPALHRRLIGGETRRPPWGQRPLSLSLSLSATGSPNAVDHERDSCVKALAVRSRWPSPQRCCCTFQSEGGSKAFLLRVIWLIPPLDAAAGPEETRWSLGLRQKCSEISGVLFVKL